MNVKRVRRGDICCADLPEDRAGSEQTGRRPVVITQSNWLNFTSPTVIIACLTSQIKNPDMECHYVLPLMPSGKKADEKGHKSDQSGRTRGLRRTA